MATVKDSSAALRALPAVNAVLDRPELTELHARHGRNAVLHAVRQAIEQARRRLLDGLDVATDEESLARRAADLLSEDRPHLRPVINASGILLHTGLGRAPLAAEAVEAVATVSRGYCNLEFDLERGERGQRTSGVAGLLCRLTGAQAATVVNNNAAATVLALRALGKDREVIVSRGQLVEIGGSFRLPEIFEVSGTRLREVGTTNKTRLADYEKAITPQTAALLRVHASNFRIVGFTEDVPIGELAALGKARGVYTIDDIGSGALGPERPPHVEGEPNVAASLAAGADLVLASGDKLLGGPQCGLLLGSEEVISRIRKDPLMRALRVDKMTLAALEATLRLAFDAERAAERIPLWAALTASVDALRERAVWLAGTLKNELGLTASVQDSTAQLGGGSVPVTPMASVAVRIEPPFPAHVGSEGALARGLRLGKPPVVARVQSGAVWLDLRSVPQSEDEWLLRAVRSLIAPPS